MKLNGSRLKEVRTGRLIPYSMKEMAKALGISYGGYRNVETSKKLKDEKWNKLCKLLELTTEEITFIKEL